MKLRFILFKRVTTYYCEDSETKKQTSLRTKDEGEATVLLNTKNESYRQPTLNLHLARTYLTAADPEVSKRTWQVAMDEICKTKKGSTLIRYNRAMAECPLTLRDGLTEPVAVLRLRALYAYA